MNHFSLVSSTFQNANGCFHLSMPNLNNRINQVFWVPLANELIRQAGFSQIANPQNKITKIQDSARCCRDGTARSVIDLVYCSNPTSPSVLIPNLIYLIPLHSIIQGCYRTLSLICNIFANSAGKDKP